MLQFLIDLFSEFCHFINFWLIHFESSFLKFSSISSNLGYKPLAFSTRRLIQIESLLDFQKIAHFSLAGLGENNLLLDC